jgi:hypothetical protein
MSKARRFLEAIGGDLSRDYSYLTKVAGCGLGNVDLDDGDGTIEIELPIDGVDPDSNSGVAVILPLTYDPGEFYTTININDVKQYLAADDGNPHDLTPEGLTKVREYLKTNKAKIERGLEDLFEKEAREKASDDGY